MRWLPPQHEFMSSSSRRRLLRLGNQWGGKTTVGCAEVIYHCLGKHPFKNVPPPPVEWWLLCASHKQSVNIQAKLWDLVPKDAVHPDQRYDPVKGFGGHHPALRFANGSIIRIKTTQQDALDLAGATIDGALFDEPPYSERIFNEVAKRVQRTGGTILLTLTPINRPTDWLRERCESGEIEDIHYTFDARHMVFVGTRRRIRLEDGTICDAEWVERENTLTPAHERPIVNDGEWETRVEGRIFSAFISVENVEGTHVTERVPKGEVKAYVGVDHGTADRNQAGVLVLVDDRAGDRFPFVYVIDETPPTGPTTSEQDAASVLGMLQRWQLEWSELERVFGDIPAGRGVARKGNRDLGDEVARALGVRNRKELKPGIWTAKMGRGAGRGSVSIGERWLHQQMVRGRFFVHPRCVHLIECFEKYDGKRDSEFKHYIDALRYALKDTIMLGGPRPRIAAVHVR